MSTAIIHKEKGEMGKFGLPSSLLLRTKRKDYPILPNLLRPKKRRTEKRGESKGKQIFIPYSFTLYDEKKKESQLRSHRVVPFHIARETGEKEGDLLNLVPPRSGTSDTKKDLRGGDTRPFLLHDTRTGVENGRDRERRTLLEKGRLEAVLVSCYSGGGKRAAKARSKKKEKVDHYNLDIPYKRR